MPRIINEIEAETLDELIFGLKILRNDANDWADAVILTKPVGVKLWEERDEDGDAVLRSISIDYL